MLLRSEFECKQPALFLSVSARALLSATHSQSSSLISIFLPKFLFSIFNSKL